MDHWRLGFVLLLSLFLCFEAEVIIKKTIWRGPGITDNKESEASRVTVIGGQPDLTPVCSNESLNIILLVNCKISMSRGKECVLLYQLGRDIADNCGSSFRLMKKKSAISLQMASLTPEDGGIYTCECSRSDGIYTLHLNVSVEAKISSHPVYPWILTIILIAGVILGIFLYKKYWRFNFTRSGTSGPHVHEPSFIYANSSRHPPGEHSEPESTYINLKRPAKDLYLTISKKQRPYNTNNKRENTAQDEGCELYENIKSNQENVKM